jgi:hypothetical protein
VIKKIDPKLEPIGFYLFLISKELKLMFLCFCKKIRNQIQQFFITYKPSEIGQNPFKIAMKHKRMNMKT